jgi:hypothetical protein
MGMANRGAIEAYRQEQMLEIEGIKQALSNANCPQSMVAL